MGIMQDKNSLALSITTALRGAGGGGGGSQRQPIESPDSLRSIAYARIVDLVSEGEIYGFADQSNPMSCVFLNETPVANGDGSLNFRNIQVDSRVGTQTQDPLPNFDGVESELGVGVELRYGTPWTRAISNLNIDSVRVRLSTPALSKTNTSNGDITGYSVGYKIELQTDGGVFITKLESRFSGKTSSKYERSHRIELPTATTGWVLRVTRTTSNSDSAAIQDSTYIESYAEIIEAKLRMPMSALVSVIVDAEQFNNIPSRAYRLKGRIIRVPSNYNPETRAYTGVWDGTFQSVYSNNPAWVFYDMALNQRYGLGHLVPQELVDKWTLYRIAQYCDGLVDDGNGGTEPRFTCNLVLQSQGDALKVMQDLATVFRGVIYATGGSVTAVSDMPEDPVYTYTPANVIEGRFVYSGSDRKVRHTVALVSWNDLSDMGRAKVEYVEDEDGIARYGVQQTEIMAIGCTSRGQARRWGRYLLATERLETDSVAFGVGLDGTIVAPGKVVNIADPLRAGQRRGGRIKSATANTVTVDLMSVSVVPGDTLVVTLPNGTNERRTIDSINVNQVFVTEDFSAIPVAQSVWAVDSVGIPLEKYRILGVAEATDNSLGFVLHGIKHQSGKFGYADTGVLFDTAPLPDIPKGAVPPPTGLTVTHRDVTDQNTTGKVINLSWDAVTVANSYNVLWRQSDGSWNDLGTTGFTNIDITGVMPGGFEVQVMAINAFGVRSVPAFGGPYEIPAVGTPPGYVDELHSELSQEILDRFNADAAVTAAAAADAQAKADAALAAANAHSDVIAAQVADITGADEWNNATAYPIGDLVKYSGVLYRALTANTNQQPDTNPDDWQPIGNYASLGEAVAASIDMGTQNASDIDAVSTQLDAVVARMPSGTGELATSASVASEISARVAGDSAAASRLDTLEARMPAGTGQLATASALTALDARVTSAEGVNTSQGSAITALQARMPAGTGLLATAASVTALDARVTTAEGNITSQASAITSLNAALFSPGGSNLISNPTGQYGTDGWAVSGSLVLSVVNTPQGQRFDCGTNASAATKYAYYDFVGASVGNTYVFSADVFANTGATGQFYLDMVCLDNSNAVLLDGANVIFASDSTWRRVSATIVAPTGTTKVRARVVASSATWTTFTFRRAKLEASSSATPYSEEGASLQSASALTALDARVTSTEGNITSQASSITALNASIGSGTNLVVNASLDAGSTGHSNADGAGWNLGTIDLAGASWVPPGRHNIGRNNPSTGVASSSFASIYTDKFPVDGGKAYIASVYLAAHRASNYFYIQFLDSAGTHISYSSQSALNTQSGSSGAGTGGQDLNNWNRQAITVTAPSNARYAKFLYRVQGNNLDSPYGWFLMPQFEEKRTAQTAPSPWSNSANGTASVTAMTALDARVTTTEAGVTTFLARYTLTLDVNGYVTGFRSENTGSTSTFDIIADKLRLLSPSGGARIEMSSSNLRVYDSGGTLRVRLGIW